MHHLLAKAWDLSRRIYASLPWGYRVAGLMLHIASSLTDTLGKVVYSEFIKAGVAEMPPLNGEVPARGDIKPGKLPSGYGKRFGERLYAALLAKSRNPDTVEEAISNLMLKIADGRLGSVREGSNLREAEQYVIRQALSELSNLWRKEHGRGERSQRFTDDIDEVGVNLSDPNSFRELDQMLPKSELSKLMRDLESVNERAPSWLEAKLDGLTGTQLAQEWGVGKSRIVGWEDRYLPAIKKVLTKYIQDAA